MGQVQTLHEFALNLLSDPQAMADFNAAPQETLNGCGLGDVSPADVHEILPLVVDTAPASLIDALGGGDLDGLDIDFVVDQDNPVGDGIYDIAAGVLMDLPNLSCLFEEVSDVLEDTHLNYTVVDTLAGVSDIVHGVDAATADLPIVGPLVGAGDIDLQNTVCAVGEHVSDGKLVGAAVDALTNHLGDALLWGTAVEVVGGLPAGDTLGDLVNDVRLEGGALIGTANIAIGSTPVGVHSGAELAAEFNDGDESLGGGLGELLGHDHDAPAGLPAVPALPLPALPALPAVGGVTGTVEGVTGHLPLGGALGGVGDVGHVAGAGPLTGAVSNVVSGAHGLDVGHVADGLDLHSANVPLSTDDLHLGF